MSYKVGFFKEFDRELFLSLGEAGSENLAKLLSSRAKTIIKKQMGHERGDFYVSAGLMQLVGRFFYVDLKLTVYDFEHTEIVFRQFIEITKGAAEALYAFIREHDEHYCSTSSMSTTQYS